MFDTPEQARAFLKRMGYLNKQRILKGDERDKMLTMLRLKESTHSNNQHLWTESWQLGNVEYQHVVGDGVDDLIEITKDDTE